MGDAVNPVMQRHRYRPERHARSVLELLDAPLHDGLTEAGLPYKEVKEMKRFRAQRWTLARIARHYRCRVSLVALAVKSIELSAYQAEPPQKHRQAAEFL